VVEPTGIIGGSGLYDFPGFQVRERRRVETPFGDPSDELVLGDLEGRPVVFLPRHGRGHRFSPSQVNYRANIWALKSVGVTRIISVSAVGSMKEAIRPGHVVVVDQFIDRTVGRARTFFEDGVVAHVAFADPICEQLRQVLLAACKKTGAPHHDRGTYICIEGPNFSTRAESLLFRTWGVSVIGMTNLPEARLAREAELSYATLALATDYDCWHDAHDAVTVEAVIAVLRENVDMAKRIIRQAILDLPAVNDAPARRALTHAIMTAPDAIPVAAKARLGLLIGKHLGAAK
jgi:5'-methylthioadenosine phosphorylase